MHCIHRPYQLLAYSFEALFESVSLRRASTCHSKLVKAELEIVKLAFGRLESHLESSEHSLRQTLGVLDAFVRLEEDIVCVNHASLCGLLQLGELDPDLRRIDHLR